MNSIYLKWGLGEGSERGEAKQACRKRAHQRGEEDEEGERERKTNNSSSRKRKAAFEARRRCAQDPLRPNHKRHHTINEHASLEAGDRPRNSSAWLVGKLRQCFPKKEEEGRGKKKKEKKKKDDGPDNFKLTQSIPLPGRGTNGAVSTNRASL